MILPVFDILTEILSSHQFETVGDRSYYVYIHFEKDTGKPFYVGRSGQKDRWEDVTGRTFYYLNVANKHGVECEKVIFPLSYNDSNILEIILIRILQEKGYRLVNMTLGGEGVKGWLGQDNPNSILTDDMVVEIRNSHLSHDEAAEYYGVGATTIYKIRMGDTWGHLALSPEWAIKRWKEDALKKNTVRQQGSKSTLSKLTEEKVLEILTSPLTAKEMAIKMGVSRVTVYDVRQGYSWKHLPRPSPELKLTWKQNGKEEHRKQLMKG